MQIFAALKQELQSLCIECSSPQYNMLIETHVLQIYFKKHFKYKPYAAVNRLFRFSSNSIPLLTFYCRDGSKPFTYICFVLSPGLFEVRAQEYLDSLPGSEQRGVNKFLKGLGKTYSCLNKSVWLQHLKNIMFNSFLYVYNSKVNPLSSIFITPLFCDDYGFNNSNAIPHWCGMWSFIMF